MKYGAVGGACEHADQRAAMSRRRELCRLPDRHLGCACRADGLRECPMPYEVGKCLSH